MLERPWDQYRGAAVQATSSSRQSTSQPQPREKQRSSSTSQHSGHSYRHQRRRHRRTLKSLPEEILAQVFREVGKDDVAYNHRGRPVTISGRDSLLSTALVCRRFHFIVTPLLYERVEIKPDNETLVRETLLEDPSLTKHIRHLKITMPKRFRTWSMKYQFAPESFFLSSRYGIDLDIFQHFKIDRYSLRRLCITDAMNVDKHMYKYIAQTFPFLEELTIESPVSFHSQWNCDGLEKTLSYLQPLRYLRHLGLKSNFNPSRTANFSATNNWADLLQLLPRLPEQLQSLSFGSLGRSEEFYSVEGALVKCFSTTIRSKEDRRYMKKHGWVGKGKKWWKVDAPRYLTDRLDVLARWGYPLRLDEVYLY